MTNTAKKIEAAKHTPGPWSLFEMEAELYVMEGRPASNVCRVDNHNKYANARLIAAAPELLEALKGLLDYANGKLPFDIKTERRLENAALAAIAKAEGR